MVRCTHLLLPRCRFRFALDWRVFLMLQAYCSLFCVFEAPASATHTSLTFSSRQEVIMIFGTSSLRINSYFLRRKITKGVWEEIVFEEHHPVKVHCSPLIDEYHAHWGEVFSLDFKPVCSYMNIHTGDYLECRYDGCWKCYCKEVNSVPDIHKRGWWVEFQGMATCAGNKIKGYIILLSFGIFFHFLTGTKFYLLLYRELWILLTYFFNTLHLTPCSLFWGLHPLVQKLWLSTCF